MFAEFDMDSLLLILIQQIRIELMITVMSTRRVVNQSAVPCLLIGDCGHYVDARSGVAKHLVEVVGIDGAMDALVLYHKYYIL